MAKSEADREKRDKEIISQIDQLKLISLCRNLVKIPSYLGDEVPKANYVANELRNLGIEVTEIPIPGDFPVNAGMSLGSSEVMERERAF